MTEGLRMIWAGLGPIPLALPNRRLGSPGEKNSREKTGPQKPSRDALSLAACRALCPPTGVSRGALGDPLSAWLPRASWGSGPSGNGWRPPDWRHWALTDFHNCHPFGSYFGTLLVLTLSYSWFSPILRDPGSSVIIRDSGYMGWVRAEPWCSLDVPDVVINIGGVCVHERDSESSCGRRRRLVCPGGALRR